MSHVVRTMVLLVFACFSQASHAAHNSEFFDFDVRRGPFFPEIYGNASGNVYLGPFGNQTVGLFLMDVLPALNSQTGLIDNSDRRVSLNFDLVVPSLALAGVNDQFTILANDHLIFQQSLLDLSFLRSRQNVQTDFILRYQPVIDPDSGVMPFDLILKFQKTGSSKTWGLDNVSVNWGQPVPEPSSAALACLSITCVLRVRRRGRKLLS